MGMAAARLLIDAGGSVTIVGRNKEKLAQARQLVGDSNKTHTFRCDLNSSKEVGSLVAHVSNEMKDVKYLINAAGVFSPKPFLEHTSEDYDAYMNLNKATFVVTQQVAKNMVENGGGAVVNVGSMWAH